MMRLTPNFSSDSESRSLYQPKQNSKNETVIIQRCGVVLGISLWSKFKTTRAGIKLCRALSHK